ncbi:MAG: hypothetical protein KF708_21140 [Pirellulales bacterium]|nr:hypothetical protein [Pirellulales bacterium]
MLKKLLIAGAGLVVLLVVLYVGLNSIYNKNTAAAERILDSIDSSSHSYYGQAQSGSLNYDTEQSILNTRILEYKQLTQWAIRPHVKARFDEVCAAAEKALTNAREMQAYMQQGQEDGEARATAAMEEMLENQRRAAEQN